MKTWVMFGSVVILGVACLIAVVGNLQTIDNSLTFSNTQDWDPELFELVLTTSTERQNDPYLPRVSLPAPPDNNSPETKAELATLHSYIHQRTPETQALIETEIKYTNLKLGPYEYNNPDFTYTTALLDHARAEITPTLLTLKYDFNRVRPSLLYPTLTTAIDIPGHPAYPSGHATESHLYALLLSTIAPEHREQFMADAAAIAHNREIAGLHYPSDSEAGRQLAVQLYPLLLQSPTTQTLLELAKAEWKRETKNRTLKPEDVL